MKFNIGDKVKFLNQTGGGVISKIISSSMVYVLTSDGFDLPTMSSELIKVDQIGKVASMFDEDFNVDISKIKGRESNSANGAKIPSGSGLEKAERGFDPGDQEDEYIDRQSALGNYSFRVKNPSGVYLAFVPHDQKWLVTGMVEIYLVNHTPYTVLYNLFLEEENKLEGKDYDVVFPGNKLLIDTLDRDALLLWSRGIVQLLFFSESPDRVLQPVSTEFDIKANRFNKEENYRDSEFLEEKSLLISISSLSSQPSVISREDSKMDEEAIRIMKARQVKPESLIEKHQTGPKEAVVDLHIGELLDNIEGLKPHDMLNIQIEYFIRCVESAVERNFHKVTFIHGVGNGSLKNAIIKKLQEYESMENHSASLAKFGVGAIDVVIRPLR